MLKFKSGHICNVTVRSFDFEAAECQYQKNSSDSFFPHKEKLNGKRSENDNQGAFKESEFLFQG
jgi:hypothetical protein